MSQDRLAFLKMVLNALHSKGYFIRELPLFGTRFNGKMVPKPEINQRCSIPHVKSVY